MKFIKNTPIWCAVLVLLLVAFNPAKARVLGLEQSIFEMRIMVLEAERKGDFRKAREMSELLAHFGDTFGMLNLGKYYLHGRGVARDHTKALRWFKMSSALGGRVAKYYLGIVYYWGLGTRRDPARAFAFMRIAAKRLGSRSAITLSLYYKMGIGTKRDDKQAALWMRTAASKYRNLARRYPEIYGPGRVVENMADFLACPDAARPDLKAAARLYKIAVAKGRKYAPEKLFRIQKSPRLVLDRCMASWVRWGYTKYPQ